MALSWAWSVLFIGASLTWLYWGYPFSGMVINESWGLHFNEVRQFKFFGYGSPSDLGEPLPFLYDPATGGFDWTFLYSRRGLVPILYLLLDLLWVGDRLVFTNLVCVGVIGLNLLLFAYIVWRLAGPAPLFPAVVVYGLYPFAAGIHFWQVIVVNNIAATFFLLSVCLFLSMDFSGRRFARDLLIFAIPSLACFWLSVFNHEYGLFLTPLYLYWALYYSHGGVTLWRFTRWDSRHVIVGWAFVLTGAVATFYLIQQAPSVLTYAPRFQELSNVLAVPQIMVQVLLTVANMTLFYVSAAFSNSVGLMIHPLVFIGESLRQLEASPGMYWSGALLVVLVLAGLRMCMGKVGGRVSGGPGEFSPHFIAIVGTVWAVLAYAPFSASVGYPRTVGLMADRVNILPSCGIALVLGTLFTGTLDRLRRVESPLLVAAGYLAIPFVVSVWLLNLYVQREHFVEAFSKEREVARAVLAIGKTDREEKKASVVLLDRAAKIVYPRAELMTALATPALTERALRILRFLVDRYFLGEVLSTSFHLKGIYLFGCCPDSAHQTFNGYARLWGASSVMVFKREEPFRLREGQDTWKLGYEDIQVWSRSMGREKLAEFPKSQYRLVMLELDESFFRFRGAPVYRLKPIADSMAVPKDGV